MKTPSNSQTLSNELRALVAATPLAMFLHAVRGDSHRDSHATHGAHTTGMRAPA